MKSVLILLAVFFIVRTLRKKLEARQTANAPAAEAGAQAPATQHERDSGEEMVQDPVCGSYVTIEDAIISTEDGRNIYFCSDECLSRHKRGH